MPDNAKIRVGESIDDFVLQNGPEVDLNQKNKGSNFVTINWPDSTSGAVTIENGLSSLKLTTVLLVSGAADDTYPSEGISTLWVSLGLPPRNHIMHEDARNKFFKLLGDIKRAGWKRWVEPGMPRLAGKDALRYQMQVEWQMSLDPDYLPDMQDWMNLKERSFWEFYKDGVFLTVYLSRDNDHMDPALPGAYFISVTLDGEANRHRLYLPFEKRQEWKMLYPPLRKSEVAERAASEAKFAALGYKIDSTYKNPDE